MLTNTYTGSFQFQYLPRSDLVQLWEGVWFKHRQSVLEQDTEPQIAPKEQVAPCILHVQNVHVQCTKKYSSNQV